MDKSLYSRSIVMPSGTFDESRKPTVERPHLKKDSFAGSEQSSNRGIKMIDTRPDHIVLSKTKRSTMNSAINDMARNHSLTRWAVRQDQSWIADCKFEPNTGNDEVDKQLDEIVSELQNPEVFDLSARHGIHSFARLIQAGRTLFGDALILKCRDMPGGRVKIFNYDRIDHPSPPSDQWQQGLELEPHTDRVLRYAIRQRNVKTGKAGDLWKVVDAKDAILHGYFEFDSESVRGTSPLAPVVDTTIDLFDTVTAATAKVKLGQIIGLYTKRKAPDSLPGIQYDEEGNPINVGDEAGKKSEDYEWDIKSNRGVFHLEMDHEDSAEILESKTPSEETMSLIAYLCRETLKALDIPYCWWDGESQNFYGSIGETNLYRKACEHKRKSHRETIREIIRFFLMMRIIEGRLRLPQGWTIDDCKFKIIPDGVAWFKPSEEVTASALAIYFGLSNPYDECEKINTNFDRNIEKTKAAMAKAFECGMLLQFGTPPQNPISVTSSTEYAKETPEKAKRSNGKTSNRKTTGKAKR